jgi:hypothetical protein
VVQPSKSRKFAFWILIGMFSVVFVEVPAGSTMFPFFTAWGLLVVLPLYLLHSVFLATVVFRFGRPRFWTLYAAGILYGLYEAYITKVVWTSFRPEGPFFTVGSIAILETILLVLYLHPLLAFVVPLFFTELLCTKSSEIAQGLPAPVRGALQRHPRRRIALLIALLGLMQIVNSPSAMKSFLSAAGNSVVMGFALLWWRKSGGAAYSLRELLPGPTGMRVYGFLLLGWYLIWGCLIKPAAIPGVFHGQLTVWCLYAVALFMFLQCLRRSRDVQLDSSEVGVSRVPPFAFSWRGFVLACAMATVVTTVARLLLFQFAPIQMLLLFAFSIVTGLALFAGTLAYISRSGSAKPCDRSTAG